MAETREFNADGSLKRLTIDNSDRPLNLSLEDLSRQIPNNVARLIYQELDENDNVLKTIDKTRTELLDAISTYSFVFDFIYYDTKEIDTIRIRIFAPDATKLSDKTLKHYLDGRRPEFI